jgi:hypothetical protein
LSLEGSDQLAPRSRELLGDLAPRSWSDDFYLAGSAALTLYVGHRQVSGLDLMSPTNRLTGPERRDLLGDLLDLSPGLKVETARDGYLFVRTVRGVAVRFFYYPYPLIEPLAQESGFAVVSAVDLGLMKLGAIISRGTRRDFVDLFLLCRRLPLETLLERSHEKFGHVRDFSLQALKSLADLSLVDGEPMPRLEPPLPWEPVEGWVLGEVRRLGRRAVSAPIET